ncbi:MAG TPA: hypothetical protein VGO18_25100 [Steroidobacteraceae bacterium]|nr:hypothetical protein [Steroidobacteraceae bacterium]
MKPSEPRAARLLLIGSGLSLILFGTLAAQTVPQRKEDSTVELSANQGVFISTTHPAKTPQGAEMRRKLSDPARREQLRAETREQVRSMHPELAQVLGLHAELESKLIDVLSDQQMAHLERFYSERPESPAPYSATSPDPMEEVRQVADQETRSKQQIRDVLGEERFERYLSYTDTLRERCAMDYFNAHLNEEDRLTADQKELLMKLLRAQQDADMARRRAESGSRIPLAKTAFSPEAMQKLNVVSNEDNFRQMQEDSRALLRQLPAILTPKQLEAYARMEAEKLASQKKYVHQIRVSAGMSPEFDDTRPREPPAKRIPVVGMVRLEIRLTANASPPVTADLVTENGKTATAFQGPEGLWVEATPALYEDGWAQVDFTYYEERRGQRHRVGGGMSRMLTRRPDGSPSYGGGGGTLSGGSNTYAISTMMKVSAVE